jgi:Putative beta-lactamase-inhibitor-like, PepSY-like
MTVRRIATSLALVIIAGVGTVAAQATAPQAVMNAFKQAYPNATILHVSRERRDGKIVYELETRDGATRRDLIYDLEGHTLEIEEILPADSVPAAVRAGLERDLKGATIMGAERVMRGDTVLYEVQARKAGRTQILTYDPEGARKE